MITLAALAIVGISGLLGYYLDTSGKMQEPSSFWCLGAFTGVLVTVLVFVA